MTRGVECGAVGVCGALPPAVARMAWCRPRVWFPLPPLLSCRFSVPPSLAPPPFPTLWPAPPAAPYLLQVKYCTGVYGVDGLDNNGSFAWPVPVGIDDTLQYRVYLRNPASKADGNSSLFTVTPYLRDVPTRCVCAHREGLGASLSWGVGWAGSWVFSLWRLCARAVCVGCGWESPLATAVGVPHWRDLSRGAASSPAASPPMLCILLLYACVVERGRGWTERGAGGRGQGQGRLGCAS
jgi:hypothetical protein